MENPAENPTAEALGQKERERLILAHVPQVHLIATKFHQHILGRVELDDLISTGVIGLIAAIDRFDSGRALQLRTYAEYRIRGAIMDSLRSLDGVTRDDRRRARLIRQASVRVEQRLLRTATPQEVATEAGLTVSECAKSLHAAAAGRPLSIDAKLDGARSGLTFAEVMADPRVMSPEQALAESEQHRVVSNAVAGLSGLAGRVITLHYAHGFTMRKIAPLVQLSEWQVQETRRKAIGELRRQLTHWGILPSPPPQLLQC